ncbi:hypothetical protein GGR56DRAFT_673849 [Xylariaceae sp. FL0804]|nr:hypothetical protein GGR56DRAFT_673849 [Xylariaceae sp. FL0804]
MVSNVSRQARKESTATTKMFSSNWRQDPKESTTTTKMMSDDRRQAGQKRPLSPGSTVNKQTTQSWNIGDVAFLKEKEAFSDIDRQELIESRVLPFGALGHPVIILDSSPDSSHHIVVTVSAYNSGPDIDYKAPWKQSYHNQKNPEDFRAFFGSERPGDKHDYLRLEEGQSWPKPKTSWVYTKASFLVPSTVLREFRRSRVKGWKHLHVTQASIDSLRAQMTASSSKFPVLTRDLKLQTSERRPKRANTQSGHFAQAYHNRHGDGSHGYQGYMSCSR